MENLVLFGAGPHANSCIDIIIKENKYNIIGVIDSKNEIGAELYGFKIIGRQENLVELIVKYKISCGIITIGENHFRGIVRDIIIKLVPDFKFVNAIHPTVSIARNVKIGIGNVMMAGVIVNTEAEIKDFCILNTGAQLEHNCTMEEFSHLSAGSVTGGFVNIGRFTLITMGVTIFDRTNIGDYAVVGSGAVVTKDLAGYGLYFGNPAKFIRAVKPGDKIQK